MKELMIFSFIFETSKSHFVIYIARIILYVVWSSSILLFTLACSPGNYCFGQASHTSPFRQAFWFPFLLHNVSLLLEVNLIQYQTAKTTHTHTHTHTHSELSRPEPRTLTQDGIVSVIVQLSRSPPEPYLTQIPAPRLFLCNIHLSQLTYLCQFLLL